MPQGDSLAGPSPMQGGAGRSQTLDEFTRDAERLGALDLDYQLILDTIDLDIVSEQVRDNFDKSQTADGNKWPPRKDRTKAHPLLILSGDLKTAALYGRRIEGQTLEHGVMGTIEYAAAQNFGNPSQNLPARTYMELSDATCDVIAEYVADCVAEYLVSG